MYQFTTPLAQTLYERVKDLPIVDFHNHLSVADLKADHRFRDLGALWLESDPYKHRAMRILGVPERLITGDAQPFEKFCAWCGCFHELVGNPLTVWSQNELAQVFGIHLPICPQNARAIWDAANELLAQPGYTARGLMDKFCVRYHAPCASFTDDLSAFAGLKGAAPSLRGDTFVSDLLGICRYLEQQEGHPLGDWQALEGAIDRRIDAFHRAGCRFSDHALDAGWCYYAQDGGQQERYTALRQGVITPEDRARLDSDVLRLLARSYTRHGWTMQLHLGANRYTSSRLRRVAGPAGGYAAIGQTPVESVTALLAALEDMDALPRTVLFSMEAASWDRLAVLTGSFNREGCRGYVQLGPAWWWCDHRGGMEQALESIAHFGCLSTFIGMTTDSRSILSFSRHDYFRRVLCNWLGEKVSSGELAPDPEGLTALARRICYENTAEYLGLESNI